MDIVKYLLYMGRISRREWFFCHPCKGRIQAASLEVWVLYHLDMPEKSGIIDFLMVDIDIVNKILSWKIFRKGAKWCKITNINY